MKTVGKYILCVLLICIQTPPPYISSAQEKNEYNIAVLDFIAEGIPESEARTLSNNLRTQVTRAVASEEYAKKTSVRYEVLERSQMDKIFDQFDIQNTGCTDISCAVEFGKMLNVERIVIGSVGLIGETYSINASIVDIESSKTVNVADYRIRGEADKLLSDGIPDVVSQLFGMKSKSRKKYYIIAGISVVALGAAAAILSSSSDDSGDSGSIHVKIPVPSD